MTNLPPQGAATLLPVTDANEDAEWLLAMAANWRSFVGQEDEAPAWIDRLESIASSLTAEPEADGLLREALEDKLDTERYKVAISVQAIRKALDGRRWLSEAGRGSYTYDDERYQQEFGAALDEIDAALEPLRQIARDLSDCPTDPLRVAANRSAALDHTQEVSE
jgi:hypothetical protein